MRIDFLFFKYYFGATFAAQGLLFVLSNISIVEMLTAMATLFTSFVGGIVLYYKAKSDYTKAKAEALKIEAEAKKIKIENDKLRQEISKNIDPPGTGSHDPGLHRDGDNNL